MPFYYEIIVVYKEVSFTFQTHSVSCIYSIYAYSVILVFVTLGQQVIRLPDGRLQLITIPQQKLQQQSQGNVVQAVAITTQSSTPTRTIQIQGASQATAIRPQTVVVNSAVSAASLSQAGITPTKIVVASQANVSGVQGAILVSSPQVSTTPAGTISIMTSSGPGIARIISPVKGATQSSGSLMAVTQTPQGPRIIRQIAGTPQIVVQGQQQPQQQQQNIQLKQQQLQQHQQVLAQQQAQLKAVQQQQIKLPTGQIIQVTGTGQQTITLTQQQLAALQQQQQQLKQAKSVETQATSVAGEQRQAGVRQAGESFQDQFVKQVHQATTNVSSNTPGSPPAVTSPSSKPSTDLTGQNKYAVTPQVVQEGEFLLQKWSNGASSGFQFPICINI